MKVKWVDIAKVQPYEHNPRKIAQKAIDAVAKSLGEFDWQQPIVVDEDMVIIVGHTRYLAAEKLGMAKVPVLIADNLSPEKVKAYRIADNRTGEHSKWDDELLKLELLDLSVAAGTPIEAISVSDQALQMTGLDTAELIRVLETDKQILEAGAEPEPNKGKPNPKPPEPPEFLTADSLEFGLHELTVGPEDLELIPLIVQFIRSKRPKIEILKNGEPL